MIEYLKDLITKFKILYFFMASSFDSWKHEIWNRNLDGRFCCDGRECGCGGATIRETYNWKAELKKKSKGL